MSPVNKQSEPYSPLMSYSNAQIQMLQGFGQYMNNSKKSKAYMQSHRSFINEPEVSSAPRCCFDFMSTKTKVKKISKADLKKLNHNWNHTTLNKLEETFRTNNKANVPEWLDGFQARLMKLSSELTERATEY